MNTRAKPAKASTKAAPAKARAEDDALPDLTPLGMGGKFVDEVTAIARTDTELFFGTGRLIADRAADRKLVLVPFVDMTFVGVRQGDIGESESETSLAPVFQKTLTLENALWLTFDVLRDIRAECVTLGKVASGEVGLDPARLAHARFFADKAREQAEMCVSLFDELAQSKEESPPSSGSIPESVVPPKDAPKKQSRLRLPRRAADKSA